MIRVGKLKTLRKLGLLNVARVGRYRIGLRLGLHPVQRLQASAPKGPFFRSPPKRDGLPSPVQAWRTSGLRFGWQKQPISDDPPDWADNPFSDAGRPDPSLDWWRIPDFESGDIKGLWELSRFDWLVAMATQAASEDSGALARLNRWLDDWTKQNPPYKGPNWKCGQEASIRVMHLCVAAIILGQDDNPEPGLLDLVEYHLQRIAPTMSYALGQQNNHGTSEAAALFIGGGFLSGKSVEADSWEEQGRRWLAERALALIEPDGTFSQYSVNYHRLMLDTYSLVEVWRRRRGLPSFPDSVQERLRAAAFWLFNMTDPKSGDAPNIGANDGARLIPLTNLGYRDFRPSVQLAASLFLEKGAYADGPWNATAQWLGVNVPDQGAKHASQSFDDGGFHVLHAGNSFAVLRYPRFRFRPGQADALHLDLWSDGENLLRDAGTFSYNAEGAQWFASTAAHNTIEFDGRSQMPQVGRFLFSDWLEAEDVEPISQSPDGVLARAAYRDRLKACHERSVVLKEGSLECADRIEGSFRVACLRWRLLPGEYALEGNELKGDRLGLCIDVKGSVARLALSEAPESRFYQQKSNVPVLEVHVDAPSTIITRVSF